MALPFDIEVQGPKRALRWGQALEPSGHHEIEIPCPENKCHKQEIRRPLLLKGGGVREGRLQVQAWLINEHNRRFNIIIIIIIIIGVVVVAAVLILIIMMTAGDAEEAS